MHHNDQPAAFKGLIITALLLFVMAYGIVQWTNAKFASHSATPAAAAKH